MLYPRICPVCRGELPERGNRRLYVPWKRGYRLVHAGECAESVEAQAVLELDRPPQPSSVVEHVRTLRLIRKLQAALPAPEPLLPIATERLIELFRVDHERREPLEEPLISVSRLSHLLARLDQVEVTDAFRQRVKRRLLADHQLVDDRPQLALAHDREVSAPARTEPCAGGAS